MTFDEALRFWYGRINYEVRSAKPGDLKLERMRALLHGLGDPHDRVRIVHVTGTKGKGSTCAILEAILRGSGYRVGLFTSPHLENVEERIQVDRVPISREELASCMAEVAPVVQRLDGDPARSGSDRFPGLTFFEIGTALGFLHFRRRRCDIAVIEVGLGGRFDSTNVCRPLVSVVTSVGYDHLALLGNTLDAIAYQKAGIIKRGVPVVSGVTQPGPRMVIRRVAEELGSPLAEIETDFRYSCEMKPAGSRVSITTRNRTYSELAVNLLGDHQCHNAAVAVAVCDRLRAAGLSIPDSAVRRGLAEVRWPARIEVVSSKPIVVLDTAHNAPSAEALVDTLARAFPTAGRKAVVLGVSSDKQYADILRILARYFDHFHLTQYSNNPRAVPVEKLEGVLQTVAPSTIATSHARARDAWHAARTAAGPDDLVCVTGSVFLAGELRGEVMSSAPAGTGTTTERTSQ